MKRFALLTVVLLLIGAGGYWLFKQGQEKAQAAELCEVVTRNIDTSGPVRTATEGSHKVAVLGDSYTAGDGLKDKTRNWVHVFGRETGRAVQFDGIGMTGFLNGGYCGGQSFDTRISRLVAEAKPELVIVQGGLNDVEFDPSKAEAAAYNILNSLPAGVEGILVGPVDAPGRDGEQAVDAALSAAAEAAGKRYVSALDWDLEFLPDRVHLTEAGHAEYARLVRASS